jgi:hypothetical protein
MLELLLVTTMRYVTPHENSRCSSPVPSPSNGQRKMTEITREKVCAMFGREGGRRTKRDPRG